jgi:indole-3-glycerol phosphate synthase
MSILATIKDSKVHEIAQLKKERSEADWCEAAKAGDTIRPFAERLASVAAGEGYGLIAELKKSSPTKGLIRPDYDASHIAAAYRKGGAACLSVLTDKQYFDGSDADMAIAREVSGLPVLRKDFIFDPVQVLQSRAMGADSILLILSVLSPPQAKELEAVALGYGMDVILECHDAGHIATAMDMKSRLIGINNRDLKTFDADLSVSETLSQLVDHDRLVVSESGLGGRQDLDRLAKSGIRCFLIGETLMRAPDICEKTRELVAPARETIINEA